MFARNLIRIALSNLCLLCVVATGQENVLPAQTKGHVGEVRADNVNVRSGPSTNYYIVAKVQAGTRLRVVEANSDWLKIVPPAGCFSVIHKDFVDVTPNTNEGVVNGDAVLVRAGSELSPELYAKQLKLNQGAQVTILKAHNDDYLRIAPPEGAHVYIAESYVTRLPDALLVGEETSTVMPADAMAMTGVPETPSEPTTAPEEATEALKGEHREELSAIDALLKAEEGKPLLHRNYGPIIILYRAMAEQKSDTYARVYAETRLNQIRGADETVSMIRGVRALGEQLTTDRNAALQARQRIEPPLPAIGGGFDAVGELRESMIYRSPLGPRRYRLVGEEGNRTLAYVDIPDNSAIEVERFLGRRVGVRSRESWLQTEDVDPLVIHVASELVPLDTVPPPFD